MPDPLSIRLRPTDRNKALFSAIARRAREEEKPAADVLAELAQAGLGKTGQTEAQPAAEALLRGTGSQLLATPSAPEGVKILGHLYTYHVGTGIIPWPEYIALCETHGIPEEERAKKPQPRHAYQQAVRALEVTEQEDVSGWGTCQVRYTVKVLGPLAYAVVREIIGTPEGSKRPDFDYDKRQSFRFVLEDDPPGIKVEWYEGTRRKPEALAAMQQRASQLFQANLDGIDHERLRMALRTTIRSFGGVPFASSAGGTWFVQAGFAARLERHSQLIRAFQKYQTAGSWQSDMRVIPCIDSEQFRAWLRTDVETELKARFEEVIEQLRKHLKRGRTGNLLKLIEARNEARAGLQEVRQRYETLLGARVQFDMPEPARVEVQSALEGRLARVVEEIQDGDEQAAQRLASAAREQVERFLGLRPEQPPEVSARAVAVAAGIDEEET